MLTMAREIAPSNLSIYSVDDDSKSPATVAFPNADLRQPRKGELFGMEDVLAPISQPLEQLHEPTPEGIIPLAFSSGGDQAVKDTNSLHGKIKGRKPVKQRGTRGRGDPRSARMTEERLAFYAKRREQERQRSLRHKSAWFGLPHATVRDVTHKVGSGGVIPSSEFKISTHSAHISSLTSHPHPLPLPPQFLQPTTTPKLHGEQLAMSLFRELARDQTSSPGVGRKLNQNSEGAPFVPAHLQTTAARQATSSFGNQAQQATPRVNIPSASNSRYVNPFPRTSSEPEPAVMSQGQYAQPQVNVSNASRARDGQQPDRILSSSRPGQMVQHHISDWSRWDNLIVMIHNLPSDITTLPLWEAFSVQGSIDHIELFENDKGERTGKGKIRFRPPPGRAFWMDGRYRVFMQDGRQIWLPVYLDRFPREYTVDSPVLEANTIDFGLLYAPKSMLVMRSVDQPYRNVVFILNLNKKEIDVRFQLLITNQKASPSRQVRNYRFRIPLAQMGEVLELRAKSGELSLVISLDTPPNFYRKLVNQQESHKDATKSWREEDTWYRQTDIVNEPDLLRTVSVSLKKANPLLNIGRWTTYRITFTKAQSETSKYRMLRDILRDFNVHVKTVEENAFSLIRENRTAVWQWIDPAPRSMSDLEKLTDLSDARLPFPVRYQLEVCICNGWLNEYNMSKKFVEKLLGMEELKAKHLLEHVANEKKRFFNPMEIFDIKIVRGVSKAKIPMYCCHTRSANITPSSIYYNSPTVETSNRIIRQYAEHADRFLRVRFTDEKFQGRIHGIDNDTMDEVFTRIKRALRNGIIIGDQHYEFLAFGNSQFREHGAYFFAPLPHLTASTIRSWMGQFNEIRVIAKHAARLGQCFSTTRAITGARVHIQELADIEREGFTFTDGVGKISSFLAQVAAMELRISTNTGEPPSVFQFRLGGCKGILTVSPDSQFQDIHIRKSQYKFPAVHKGLEIIRWSQNSMASLNRQLILVLSALGVEDEIFRAKLISMLSNLEAAMSSDIRALYLLQKYVDPNQMTLTLASMILDGFQAAHEPFMTSLLELWRAWSIKYLKEKAKIIIEQGACLFGCIDETATLRGYFEHLRPEPEATTEEKFNALPEIFVQISIPEQKGKAKVIEGICLLARNPSLHPGDIRVVKAVNVPGLKHLKDVVVLPQTGDRDIASMCSGGDLDGDDYIVIWDPDLIPTEWYQSPMDYSAPKPKELDRDVRVDDITTFFVTYMKEDRLRQIAHAHMAWADQLDEGVNDDKCVRLAALHSRAVDYPKTGDPAKMTRDLKPRQWPHFMEKKHKSASAIYNSKKILGQIYDLVERVDFVPNFGAPFDDRILNSGFSPSTGQLQAASELKEEYDAAMRRTMAQHEIKTEFEVWSTFVLSHAQASSDYKFHEELGNISTALRDQFQLACYEKVGSKDFEIVAPFVVAMYQVTQEEMDRALEECQQTRVVGGQEVPLRKMEAQSMPLMSFPWVLQNELGKIASNRYEQSQDRAVAVPDEGRKVKRVGGRKGLLKEQEVETTEGVKRPGEVLQLFDHEVNADPFAGLDVAFGERNSAFQQEDPTGAAQSHEPENTAPTAKRLRLSDPPKDTLIALDDAVELTTVVSSRSQAIPNCSPGRLLPYDLLDPNTGYGPFELNDVSPLSLGHGLAIDADTANKEAEPANNSQNVSPSSGSGSFVHVRHEDLVDSIRNLSTVTEKPRDRLTNGASHHEENSEEFEEEVEEVEHEAAPVVSALDQLEALLAE